MKTIILSFATAIAVVAADTNEVRLPSLTIGTNTYKKVVITRRNALEAIVRFDGGITKVKITELPEPYRTKWHDEGEANREQQEREDSRTRAAKAKSEAYLAEFSRKEADGSLRMCGDDLYDFSEVDGVVYVESQFPRSLRRYHVEGRILQVLADGMLVKDGRHGTVYVDNYPTRSLGTVDDDPVNFMAVPTGTYSYRNTLGAKATVQRFDVGVKYDSRKHEVGGYVKLTRFGPVIMPVPIKKLWPNSPGPKEPLTNPLTDPKKSNEI